MSVVDELVTVEEDEAVEVLGGEPFTIDEH